MRVSRQLRDLAAEFGVGAVGVDELMQEYSTAVLAVSSAAWMLPSVQNAGLSRDTPVARLVSVTTQMSRSRGSCPSTPTLTSPGAPRHSRTAAGSRFGVAVEGVEGGSGRGHGGRRRRRRVVDALKWRCQSGPMRSIARTGTRVRQRDRHAANKTRISPGANASEVRRSSAAR